MSKSKPIYLDYASTTPVDERVAEKMLEYMTFNNNFGNAASRSHSFGWQADEAVELASCLLYTSPSPRDRTRSRMPSSA